MEIHNQVRDKAGSGKWDITTTRYVPEFGGSRSRLPLYDDPFQRRYAGFVGIDEHLTAQIFLISTLYHYIGGKPVLPPGDAGKFLALLLGQTLERLEEAGTTDVEEEDEGEE